MTTPPNQLERDLAALSTWEGDPPTPSAYQRAVAAEGLPTDRPLFIRRAHSWRRELPLALAAGLLVAVSGAIVATMLPVRSSPPAHAMLERAENKPLSKSSEERSGWADKAKSDNEYALRFHSNVLERDTLDATRELEKNADRRAAQSLLGPTPLDLAGGKIDPAQNSTLSSVTDQMNNIVQSENTQNLDANLRLQDQPVDKQVLFTVPGSAGTEGGRTSRAGGDSDAAAPAMQTGASSPAPGAISGAPAPTQAPARPEAPRLAPASASMPKVAGDPPPAAPAGRPAELSPAQDAYSADFARKRELAAAAIERQVAHRATIDLAVPDVRAAFRKAQLLVSDLSGEYVQESTLTADAKDTPPATTATATLTLRVNAARLPTVLAQLRDLGSVKSENTLGEDVTTQTVDLESRLRNERLAESDLRALLDARKDAALKDILEVNAHIARVRQNVESISGQQQRLSRLVTLAAIYVTLHSEPQPPKPQAALDRLGDSLSSSWQGGLDHLFATAAWIVETLIGGALWWAALAAGIFAYTSARRRTIAKLAAAPAS